MAYFKWRC